MKITVSSGDLLRHLQSVSGALSSNPVMPILDGFHFIIKNQNLEIRATDLETSISTHLPVQADGDCNIVVPSRLLLETLKALEEQPVSMTVDEETYSLSIESLSGHYKLAVEPGEDYPARTIAEDTGQLVIPAKVLYNGIVKTLFATSTDELRPAMGGVFFDINFNKIHFVSTDAHKLVKCGFSGLQSDVSTSFIAPRKALNLLKNVLPDEGDVVMKFTESNVFFHFEDVEFVVRLIESQFPDYSAVIPLNNDKIITVDRQKLIRTLRRVSIFANKTTFQAMFTAEDNQLTIVSRDVDFNNEAKETIACTYEHESITTGYNSRFFMEMLVAMDTDEVNICLSEPRRAGIIVPTEEEEGHSLLMLIMPILVNY